MTINILAFGIIKEIFNSSTASMEVQDDVTVAQLIASLNEKHPRLSTLSSFAIAVNGTYASPDMMINEHDELAIIPPVSGG